MGEFNKKWFQIVWLCLLLASITTTYIQRMSDALWAHGEVIQVLDKVLMWITLPLTIILFVWLCVGYWRQSERLFWRKCRRWGSALAIGVIVAVVLVILVRYVKGEGADISEGDRALFIGAFAVAGLVWSVARYKFQHWRKDE